VILCQNFTFNIVLYCVKALLLANFLFSKMELQHIKLLTQPPVRNLQKIRGFPWFCFSVFCVNLWAVSFDFLGNTLHTSMAVLSKIASHGFLYRATVLLAVNWYHSYATCRYSVDNGWRWGHPASCLWQWNRNGQGQIFLLSAVTLSSPANVNMTFSHGYYLGWFRWRWCTKGCFP
jgi:hypothetical protein